MTRAALVELAEVAGWPVLAEPSSGARHGPNALTGYQYLLASAEFMAAHRPDVVISAGRPGLSRPQSALLRLARGTDAAPPVRHVAVAQGPGMWADPQRAATDVAAAIRLTGAPAAETMRAGAAGAAGGRWLDEWRRADAAATEAADKVLDAWPESDAAAAADQALSEPEVARELVAALPARAMLWCGNSLSVRDIDLLRPARTDTRVIASRGASGIDGTFSAAAGAALAHAADHPGAVAFALIGDLSLLHDAPGLAIGPGEPRPDLCVVVVNNDGGGIFEGLEPAGFGGGVSGLAAPGGPQSGGPGGPGAAVGPGALTMFERTFGTPHGASLERLAAAFGIPYAFAGRPGDVAKAIAAMVSGTGPRIVEARTGRAANAELRARMSEAAIRAVAAAEISSSRPSPSA